MEKRLVGNQEEESTEIPISEAVIKKSCFLTGRDYNFSSSRGHVRFHRLLPCHYRKPPPETTDGIASLKKLQEQQQTPVSMDEDELDLSLWFSSTDYKKRKTITTENHPKRPKLVFDSDSDYAVALNLWRMRNYSKEDIAEEERLGVTTKLSVYDPWRMKKDLMASDIGNLSRLMLKSDWAEKYFLPHLDIKQVESENGVPVRVFDSDTNSEHELAFKLWKSSNSYVLKRGWVKDFVKRRNLKKDDKIGMFSHVPLNMGDDPPHSTLKIHFCVLQRAEDKKIT